MFWVCDVHAQSVLMFLCFKMWTMQKEICMKYKRYIPVTILILVITGCSSIPQAAIDVNKQVSIGIKTIGENGIEMVSAWQKSAYNMLDERWSLVYAKADATYRTGRGIASGATLTAQQQEEVAGLSVLIREEVIKKIDAKTESMRTIINENTKNTLAANDSITNLLISANAVATLQQTAIQEVGNLLPIPPAVSTFITNTLQTAGI